MDSPTPRVFNLFCHAPHQGPHPPLIAVPANGLFCSISECYAGRI